MTKYIFLSVIGVANLSIQAQTSLGDVPIVPDSYAHKISSDGRYISGETSDGSAFVLDNKTGNQYYYQNGHAGMGNSIALNGWVVGSLEDSYPAVIMTDGEIKPVETLKKFSESYIFGITNDASRMCGIVINPKINPEDNILDPGFEKQMYVPYFCNISSEGEIGEPQFLPFPEKDFFGTIPQYCSAVWISENGKTILGQVIESSGWFTYPIIYQQNNDGNWEYSLPSEKLFNVNGLPLPAYPFSTMTPPDVFDYISDPEKKIAFEEQLIKWDQSMWSEEEDPYRHLEFFMSPEEIGAYNEAVEEYSRYVIENEEKLSEYYMERERIIKDSAFFRQGSMTMNLDGTLIATPRTFSYTVSGSNFPVIFSQAYVFNLTDGTYKAFGNEFGNVNTNQLLPDGTMVVSNPVASGSSADATPVHTSLWLPGADDYITLDEYLSHSNPWAVDWINEYLTHEVPIGYDEKGELIYRELAITGLASFSDDLSVVAGGVDSWSWNLENGMVFTYILSDLKNDSGVEEIYDPNATEKDYKVYNLTGSLIMEATQTSDLNNLKAGIYIINGKKYIIR